MRQSFVVIFLFCMFLFVIGYFPVDFSKKLKPELFIDPDVLVVSKNYNFLKRVKTFQATPLAGALDTLDYSLLSSVLDFPVVDPEEITAWKDSFESLLEHPLAVEILGKEFTVALFKDNNGSSIGTGGDPLDSLLVIARPRHHARIIELVSAFMDDEGSLSEARYGGYTIKRIPLQDNRTVARDQGKGPASHGFQ